MSLPTPLRDLFGKRDEQAREVFTQLTAAIAIGATQIERAKADHLDHRLAVVASAVKNLAGVTGALVVVCDLMGEPLRFKQVNLAPLGERPLISLGRLCSAAEEGVWSDVGLGVFDASDAEVLKARTIEENGRLLGLLIVAAKSDAIFSSLYFGLDLSLSHLRWVLKDALLFARMRCMDELRKIERDEIGRSREIKPDRVAERIRKILEANAVTIFVREQGKLYLSASTDPKLAAATAPDLDKIVLYAAGEGLTGRVLSTGEPINLRDATDREEISAIVDSEFERSRPRHPEALAKTGEPFRFLAVPMRSAWSKEETIGELKSGVEEPKVRGVLRVLREDCSPPFTQYELAALQDLADLLAIAMYASWRLHLADRVMEAETEAICISRSEPGKDQGAPRVVYADKGAVKLFNLSKEELRNKSARELYAEGDYEKVRSRLEKALVDGKQECGPYKAKGNRFNSLGDEERTLSISYRFVTSPFVKPDVHYTIAVILDISESQIEADKHERLVELLDMKGLAYFRADKQGLTLESSVTESRLTGYSLAQLAGKPRKELYKNPAERDKLLRKVQQRDGELVQTGQRLRKKDGEVLLTEGVIHLLKDDNGDRIGYEGLYEDISERYRLQGFLDVEPEKVLREHELFQKLEENARFQLLFMTSLGHQLRSPIGALVQHLVNFRDNVVEADRFSKRLVYAIGQARVSAALVTNLTYMDKILRGETFAFRRIDIARLAIETKLDFEHLLPDKRLNYVIDSASLTKHLRVWGHRELLRQILVNLTDNAIKYSLPNTTIRVGGHYNPSGRYLQISSRGLPLPKDRNQVFDRGFRTPQAQMLIPAGTGLGLWLVRKIAKAHGASIRCNTILENGHNRAAFQVFFPEKPLKKSVGRYTI